MTFGQVIEALRKGQYVRRAGWNGKGMFLFLAGGVTCGVSLAPMPGLAAALEGAQLVPSIFLRTAQSTIIAWNASQADALADDWEIIEPRRDHAFEPKDAAPDQCRHCGSAPTEHAR